MRERHNSLESDSQTKQIFEAEYKEVNFRGNCKPTPNALGINRCGFFKDVSWHVKFTCLRSAAIPTLDQPCTGIISDRINSRYTRAEKVCELVACESKNSDITDSSILHTVWTIPGFYKRLMLTCQVNVPVWFSHFWIGHTLSWSLLKGGNYFNTAGPLGCL